MDRIMQVFGIISDESEGHIAFRCRREAGDVYLSSQLLSGRGRCSRIRREKSSTSCTALA